MNRFSHLARQALLLPGFGSSRSYWDRRYRLGGNSGDGSYGALAEFKANVINELVRIERIASVIEYGCGDGNQLTYAAYPHYLGFDISRSAVENCRERFKNDSTKTFLWLDPNTTNLGHFAQADLTLSLDVIYHLVEDDVYRRYLDTLFATSRRLVVVYSSDSTESQTAPHVRHRQVTRDIAAWYPPFRLRRTIENRFPEKSPCRFFIYEQAEKLRAADHP